MKFIKLAIVISFIAGVVSCKKAQLAAVNSSNDDAAIILGSSLATNNYGMNLLSTDISGNALELMAKNLSCGQSVTDSIQRKNMPGTAATYIYKLKYTNTLNCNSSNLPDNLTNSLTYSGNFNGPKITFTNSGSTNYHIAGLTPTATVHTFNGEYKGSGSYKFKTDTTNKGTASIYMNVKNLVVSKANHNVMGGTAMVIVTGTSTKKSTFTYNGTLTFINAFSASLLLNGTDYTVDLVTGDITKK
jgi:hypothetical protein